MPKASLENPQLLFSLSDLQGGTVTFPANLPEWLRTLINQSKEMSDRHTEEQPAPVGAVAGGGDTLDEDVPF
jgi:hypothetical protein